MKYFAKLIFGSQYFVGGKTFVHNEELEVSEDLAKYLEKLAEPLLLSEGNGYVVKELKRFEVRSVELTIEEKVDAETKDVGDTLKLKPGRKPAA